MSGLIRLCLKVYAARTGSISLGFGMAQFLEMAQPNPHSSLLSVYLSVRNNDNMDIFFLIFVFNFERETEC